MKNLKRKRTAYRGVRKRSGQGRGRQRSRHYKCLLEAFESRLLLSAAPASIGANLDVAEGESHDGNSSLSGYVYLDANSNGARDADDVGVPGTLITLTGSEVAGEQVNRTAITLNNGFYEFRSLSEGTYEIRETQPHALLDGPESTSVPNSVTDDDRFSEVALSDELTYSDNNFAEARLLPEYMSLVWFFASSSPGDVFREMIALGEEQAGNLDLAAAIRAGETGLDNGTNRVPIANADSYEVGQGDVLDETAATGVLANDTDADGQTLTANLVNGTANGELNFNSNGSFTYTPNVDFVGVDQFTYTASDTLSTSKSATVTITVGASVQTLSVNENAAAGTLVGTIRAPAELGDTVIYEINDPNVASDLNLVPDDHLSGDPTASVVLVEYLDFQCPNCAALHPTIQQLEQEFDGSLLVVRRHLPLTNVHPNAFDAARAAEAAGRQDMFEEMGDLLFENQEQWASATDPQSFFETYATDLGLDLTKFLNDLVDPAIGDRITRDQDAADRLGASATPTLFLNGDQIAVPGNFDAFEQLMQAELAELEEPFAVNRRTGAVIVTANANLDFETSPSFAYEVAVTDLDGVREVVDVIIQVLDINDPPVARGESYEVNQGSVLEIDATKGTLINDVDEDGDTLTAELVTAATSGELNLNDDGSFTYTPNGSFSGSDTFAYRASDGSLFSATVTVSIAVIHVNQPPDSMPDEYTVDEDGVLQVDAAAGVLANDNDDDDDLLSAVLVATTSNGTLTLETDGSFGYTPDANFNGTDTFTYKASDGTFSSDVTDVTITVRDVNDEPEPVADEYDVDEDNVLNVDAAGGLLANDTDADGDTLTVTLVNPPADGSVTLNSDGSFTYTPNANFFGTDRFTYTVGDGISTSLATSVTVNVMPVNDDNPVSLDDDYDVPVDGVLLIDAGNGVLANDSDADGDALFATLVSSPTGGTVILNEDGSFRYTPDAGFHDVDFFTYVASDGNENGNESTVTIIVNSPANGLNDTYQIDEDNVLDIDTAAGLLANDSDVDGDTLTISLAAEATHGTVTVNADGSFLYVPDPDFNGIDSFRYTINDGFVDSGPINVGIMVNPVNDAPVTADDVYVVPINGQLVVEAAGGVLANDSDADGEALVVVVTDGPTHGTLMLNEDGSFSYTPDMDFHAIDSFTYEASDGTVSSESTVSIEVNTVPMVFDATLEIDEDEVLTLPAPGVLVNGDIDGDELAITLIQSVTNGNLVLSLDGSFEYTPNANFHGSDVFTYVLNDGFRDSEVASVTINVNSVNDPPEVLDDEYEVEEDMTLDIDVAMGVLSNDSDVEGDPLTVGLIQTTAHGNLELNPDGSFSYAPDANYHGLDSFSYVASDSFDNSVEATVTITVISVNDLPMAEDDNDYEIDEDNRLEIDAASGVLANDSDVDAVQLTARVVQMPTDGRLTLFEDGSFVFSPDANFNGVNSFTYVANDGFVDSAEATVTITINSVNDLPMPMADAYTLEADSVLDLLELPLSGMLANDIDEDDVLTVDQGEIGVPFFGQLRFKGDGSFLYKPNTGFSGEDAFRYRVTDGKVFSGFTTVTLTVLSDRPLPQAIDDTFEVAKNGTLDIEIASGLLANDSDPEEDTLVAIVVTPPAHGTLVLIQDDEIEPFYRYTPNFDFTGTDSFTYRAADGSLLTSSTAATVTINVLEQAAAEGESPQLSSVVDLVFADDDLLDI